MIVMKKECIEQKDDKYTEPVTFEETNKYGNIQYGDDVYTVDEFKKIVALGGFTDYDGHGYAVKNNKADMTTVISPSKIHLLPDDATHIVWFNR